MKATTTKKKKVTRKKKTVDKSVKMYRVEGIQCPRCQEKLWSKFGHDFHYCSCGYCFVDGGAWYLRYGWGIPYPHEGTTEEQEAAMAETARIGKPEVMEWEVPEDTVPSEYRRITDGRRKKNEKTPL